MSVNSRSAVYLFIIIHSFVWWLVTIYSKVSLDSYGDMLEAWAWSQHFLLGSDKHPQFLPWIISLWFGFMPRSTASFFGLSAINIAIGLFGIATLAHHFLQSWRKVFIVVAATILAFPYLTLSSKLNMNSISLSIWPWMSWFFVVSLSVQDKKTMLINAVLLGAVGALGMMGKYHTVVLLVSFFVISLMAQNYWKKPSVYIAVLSFCIVMSPHILWLYNNDFALFSYATDQGSGLDVLNTVKFGLFPLLYWPLSIILILTLFYKGSWSERIKIAVKMNGKDDVVWLIALLPYLITLLLGVLGVTVLSLPWSIPVGFGFAILLIRNANQSIDQINLKGVAVARSFIWIWLLFGILGGVYTYIQISKSKDRHYKPAEELSRAVLLKAKENGYQLQNGWVASATEATKIAFYSPKDLKLESLPSFPANLPAYYPRRENWLNEPGVIICGLGRSENVPTKINSCYDSVLKFMKSNNVDLKKEKISVYREGFLFPQKIDYFYDVYFYLPK